MFKKKRSKDIGCLSMEKSHLLLNERFLPVCFVCAILLFRK